MRSRTAIACSLLLLSSEAGLAQVRQPVDRWSTLPAVHQSIRVETKSGEKLKGFIQSAEARRLMLREKSGRGLSVERDAIERITRRSRVRGALYGLAAGFATGFVIGAAAGPYIADFGNPGAARRVKYGIGFGAFSGGIGAGIGALAGARLRLYP